MIGTVPPSTDQAAPVTYEARGDRRNTITSAISPGSARRPSGLPAATFARTSSRSPCCSASPPAPSQMRGRGRPGRHGVATDPVAGVHVCDKPRVREQRRLQHRVVGHAERRALRCCRRHVDDRRPRPHVRQRSARGAHGGHQVELERLLPVVVGELAELADVRSAGVVDEAVDAAEALDRGGDEPVCGTALRQVGCDMELARAVVAAPGRDDVRALGGKSRRDLEADAGRRAGDETDLSCETEIHGSLR